MWEKLQQKVKRIIEKIVEKQWRKRLIEAIVKDEFKKVKVRDYKIAKTIIEWSSKSKEPVSYFLECLQIMGISGEILLRELQEKEKSNLVLLKEKNKQRDWKLTISRVPEEYLKLEQEDLKIIYNVWRRKCSYKMMEQFSAPVFMIEQKNKIKVAYHKQEKIYFEIGKDIQIFISEVEWEHKSNLYEDSISMIRELSKIDKLVSIYEYYCHAKNIISQYWDLQKAEILIMRNNYLDLIKTENAVLLDYQDPIKGIIIKMNLSKGHYDKEYRKNGINIEWKDEKMIIPTEYIGRLEQNVTIAKQAIEEVENLKF